MSSQPGFVHVTSSVVSNAVTVARSIVINPTESSTVNLYIGSDAANTATRPVQLPSFYKWLTAAIFVVALLCLLFELGLGFAWPDPTEAQKNIMSAIDYGWKMGFGFAIGLITGKSVL
jgi:hypothetical protein